MDTKWRNYSHSIVTKIIVFIIVVVCFTGGITSFVNVIESNSGNFGIAFEENYYKSKNFMWDSSAVIRILTRLITEYKSEEHVLNGKTVSEDEISREISNYYDGKHVTLEENVAVEVQDSKDDSKISQVESKAREKLISEDLGDFNSLLRGLNEFEGVIYYVSDGENIFTNKKNMSKEYFKSLPAYMMYDSSDYQVYPKDIKNNQYYYWINTSELDRQNNILYIGFTDEFLSKEIEEWEKNKEVGTTSLYRIGGFLLGLILSSIYLFIIIGRKTFGDKELSLNTVDRLYNDINLVLCLGLITLWFALLEVIGSPEINRVIAPWTASIAILGLILVLSLVKHLKNKTFLKHTLIFSIFNRLFRFLKDVYNSGSLGVKIALIVILYPILTAGTFFMFPVTIGFAVWLANKKVKEFNAIKEGVERVKNGDIHHGIKISGEGEFAKLATNINSITDGLNKAVDNELRSERLKTELITNVSHDIRTPLTSIITYVDLLKKEEDKTKVASYLDVLEQKSQKLKILTEDLFEAAKASSGSIPVNYEKIDILSLITQGLGELNHKIEESDLEFKINHPKEKVLVNADGKLLWRAIENLLSNIFKYALAGSRVYIDIKNMGNDLVLAIKNISAYELNISSEELMERFKRGDESRTSQGSGLGLSIAKSLIEVQSGEFDIEIDGDLFKAIIRMPIIK